MTLLSLTRAALAAGVLAGAPAGSGADGLDVRASLDFGVTLEVGSAPAAPVADTTVQLRAGDRVVLENLSGDVSVGAWNRQELEVRTDDDDAGITVRRSGSTVRVSTDDRKRRSRSVDASIRIPASVDLQVSGRSLDVVVEGVNGRIDVNNISGSV